MKLRNVKIIEAALVLLLGACASGSPPPGMDPGVTPTQEATIYVTVRGLENREGRVLLALFAAPDGFPGDPGKAVRRMESVIESDSVEFTIEKVRAGTYALSIFHDENDNGAMETGVFGSPSEGYGFSQNARGTFGPPGFDDAAFEVSGEPVIIEIDLIYH